MRRATGDVRRATCDAGEAGVRFAVHTTADAWIRTQRALVTDVLSEHSQLFAKVAASTVVHCGAWTPGMSSLLHEIAQRRGTAGDSTATLVTRPTAVRVRQSTWCVSVCATSHTHTHTRTHTRTYTRTYTHARTHARTRVHTHAHAFLHALPHGRPRRMYGVRVRVYVRVQRRFSRGNAQRQRTCNGCDD